MSYSYAGSLSLSINAKVTASGSPLSGNISLDSLFSAVLAPSGGTAPTISGFLAGSFTAASGDLLLAHATDPFQAMGSETYSAGFSPAGAKLKILYIKNTDSTNTITVARKSSTGLPIFDAGTDSVTLAPGDVLFLFKKAGTSALTTGSNDGLTISVDGGSPTADLVAVYGP